MNKFFSKPFIAGLTVIFVGTFLITYLNLYSVYPHLDKVMHVSGGFIVAWFFATYWKNKFSGFTDFERMIVLVGLAALVGIIWEVGEYSTSLPPLVHHQLLRHYVYGGSLIDTLGDLVADSFGAAVYGFLSRK